MLTFNRVRLWLVLLAAFALRVWQFNAAVWGDETASWAFARRAPFGEMWDYGMHDTSPPLYYALLHFTLPLFGATPFALRMISLLCGVLLVALVWRGMKQLDFDERTSLWAVLLAAASSVLIYYTQEARQYSLIFLETTAATLLLLACIRRLTRMNAALYLLTLVLLSFTHTATLLLIAAHWLCLVLLRRWRLLLFVIGATIVATSVLSIRLLTHTYYFAPSGRAADGDALLSLLNTLSVGTVGMQTVDVLPNPRLLAFPVPLVNTLLPFVGLATLTAIVLIGIAARRQFSATQRQALLVLATCIVASCALALLAGSPLSPQPQWLLRSVLFVCPMLFMLSAALCSRSRWQAPALSAILLINVLCLLPYHSRYTRAGDEDVLIALNERARANDVIVADPWYMHDFIRYYYSGSAALAGYDEAQGWLDVAQMERSNEARLFFLSSPPRTDGDIYVFYRGADLQWAMSVQARRIFVYDPALHAWREYARK